MGDRLFLTYTHFCVSFFIIKKHLMKGSYMKEKVIIVDFGSQYSQLIARRIREMEVYCEITHEIDVDAIKSGREKVKGIIFSGGPASVYEEGAPTVNKEVFELGLPILGICYGMQLITHLNGGKVEKAESREFGKAILEVLEPQNDLLVNVKEKSQVWMSHGDHVTELPKDFTVIAKTDSSIAAITNNKGVYALQFHPEVVHSEEGAKLIENFLFNVCKCEKNWKIKSFIEEKTKQIKETVGNEHVILGLSGGVDSSVAAVLINNAIHKQLTCVFVDTGLLRKDEGKKVLDYYKEHFDLNIIFVDAKDRFQGSIISEGVKK
jgi:GMP synthase (glutamine-hydrolysing)